MPTTGPILPASKAQVGVPWRRSIARSAPASATRPSRCWCPCVGARASGSGMMDTVLNLGLNDDTVQGLLSGNPSFAWDSYRRFIQMYANVVLDIAHHHFEDLLEIHKGAGLPARHRAEPADCASGRGYKAKVAEDLDRPFLQDPPTRRWGARAVFGSWMNERAITYRRLHRSRPTGAPRSTAGHGVRHGSPPASPSPATRRPAPSASSANSWSTPRARTWLPASARRSLTRLAR